MPVKPCSRNPRRSLSVRTSDFVRIFSFVTIALGVACAKKNETRIENDPWRLKIPQIVGKNGQAITVTTETLADGDDRLVFFANNGEAPTLLQITSNCEASGEFATLVTKYEITSEVQLLNLIPLALLPIKTEYVRCEFEVLATNARSSTHRGRLPFFRIDIRESSSLNMSERSLHRNDPNLALKLPYQGAVGDSAQLICGNFKTKSRRISEQNLGWHLGTDELASANPEEPRLVRMRQTCRFVVTNVEGQTTGISPALQIDFGLPKLDFKWDWYEEKFQKLNLNGPIGRLTVSNANAADIFLHLPDAKYLFSIKPYAVALTEGDPETFPPSRFVGNWMYQGQIANGPILLRAKTVTTIDFSAYHRCGFHLIVDRYEVKPPTVIEYKSYLVALETTLPSERLLQVATDRDHPHQERVTVANLQSFVASKRNEYNKDMPFQLIARQPRGRFPGLDPRICLGSPFGLVED